ncbi:efflux RND transporter permease subunit [Beijerinckia indica]|uniref:Acriflavin resistance protein n=1 Tax=Beijerinckia indica subsp. indica (strain ATCC 9039 / DSM 1715 / NCIMB 8712) TaxID=395963 RepID=B2IBQ8_BEII9|nr:efflux RND transporter permease subunit [Beijerinckia indica]ACB93780.1 acriflavin resistance protein [Beijerinckia indica subsp. indica ATCC 9039]
MNAIVVTALRRPYTFVVLSLLILMFGVMSVFKTPTDVFPNIKIPVVSVVWTYAGLMPEDVGGRIVRYYEQAVTSTVEGIEHIESTSYYGSAIVNIYFQPGTDLGPAESDVVAISQTVIPQLPPGISPPMIMRLEASSVPVVTMQVTSDSRTPADLYNLAFARIRPFVVTVPGAIIPHPYGGKPPFLLVNLNQQQLLAHNLSGMDVENAFEKQSIVLPAGDQKIGRKDWMVQTNAIPMSVERFEDLPIKKVGNAFVHLRDIADVSLSGPPQTNAVLVKGKQAVLVVVMKSGEASTLDVVQGVKDLMPRLQKLLPPDVHVQLLNDASIFVKDSIQDVVREMATAAALTGLVVLLFLGSWRATVIIATSIPLAILCAIIGLGWAGQTINVMTLGGLALAVGILVDDATVMIENIDTHLEMGKDIETAIIDAANQIVIPTFVATLCICIVWFPLFTLSGVSGWLFMPMAEAIIFAMIASFILSRTLVPTMAKYLLAGHAAHAAHEGAHGAGAHGEDHANPAEEALPIAVEEQEVVDYPHAMALKDAAEEASFNEAVHEELLHQEMQHETVGHAPHAEKAPGFFSRFQKGFEKGFSNFRESYRGALEKAVMHRGAFITVFLVLTLGSMTLFYFSGRDFFPEIKSGTLQMHMRAPLGTRIEVTSRIVSLVNDEIEKLLPGQVENIVNNCGLPVGPHNLAFIPTPTIGTQDCDLTISLKNETSPVWDFRRILRKGLSSRFPGTIFTFQPADLTAKILNFGSPSPIDVQISGLEAAKNYDFARKLAERLSTIPGAADVTIQQTMRTPTIMVNGNRTFGLGTGMTEQDLANNELIALSGSQQIHQSYWLNPENGLSYPINIYTPQEQLTSVNDLLTIPVSKGDGNPEGKAPQFLGSMSSLEPKGTPGQVSHYNLIPLFDLYVSNEGRDLGGVLDDVNKVIASMEDELPRGAAIDVRGQAETMHSSYSQLIGGLVISVVLVYLLIVVNFQSWLDPFIIITALPGALAGIAWSLFLTGTNLSIPALTGAIMCMGTATANSILIVSFARERFEIHGDAIRAAIEAGYGRIRPVIMTASAMIIGMLPMSMSNSQNAPLGRAVIGGLTVATFATLMFVPCVYALVYNRTNRKKESA